MVWRSSTYFSIKAGKICGPNGFLDGGMVDTALPSCLTQLRYKAFHPPVSNMAIEDSLIGGFEPHPSEK